MGCITTGGQMTKYDKIDTLEEYKELEANLLSSLDDSELANYKNLKATLKFYEDELTGKPIWENDRIVRHEILTKPEQEVAKRQYWATLHKLRKIEQEIGLEFVAKSYCATQAKKMGIRIRGL